MKAYLAIDSNGSANLFKREPTWHEPRQSWCGQSIEYTGPLPPIAAGEYIPVELEIAEVVDTDSHAPRLPERATTRTGRHG